MSEEEEAEVIEAPEEAEEAPQEAEEQTSNTPSPNEDKARAMGWTSKEEWEEQGKDPEMWRDADAFVERQENSLTMTRERLDAALTKISKFESQIEEQKDDFAARIDRQEKMTKRALERQRSQLEDKYREAQRAAAEMGDLDKYDALDAEKSEALTKFDEDAASVETETKPEKKKPTVAPEDERTVEAFRAKNRWFGKNKAMTAMADAYHIELLESKPGMSLEENLAAVEAEVRKRFADKFADTNQGGASPAEGGGRHAGSQSRKKTARDLPDEARKAGAGFVEDGLYKSLDEYAADYFAEGE